MEVAKVRFGWFKTTGKRCISALPSATTLSTWANIAGGFSTFAAAVLAIWAYFFTDIAQELTRQYNAEVSALNEQVVDLRRERRDLDSQVQVARAEKEAAVEQLAELQAAYQVDKANLQASIESLDQDRAQLQGEIAALENLSAQLRTELSALQDERAIREKELRKIEDSLLRTRKDKDALLVELIGRRVNGQLIFARVKLTELKNDAMTARDITKYKTWRGLMDKILPPDQSKDEFVTLFEIRNVIKTMPQSWRSWWRAEFSQDPPVEFAEVGTKDGLTAFRHRLSKTERRITALQFVKANLLDNVSAQLPPDDHKRVTKAVDTFYKNHASLLAEEIAVIHSKTTSEEEIADSGTQTLQILAELEVVMERMGAELGTLIAPVK